jgi:3-hydroxybutyryl-CoA dehydratase
VSRALRVGDRAERAWHVTDADIRAFAALSGDLNPVHLDDAFAAGTRFGQRIAHGALVAGRISALLGTELPGPGAIYLSQTLRFLAPVFIDDRITAMVEVTAMRSDKPVVTLHTRCVNQDGVTVIDGEAVLVAPPAPTRDR